MAGALFDCKTCVAADLRRLCLAIGFVALLATPAFAFDFARYQAADLDDILAQPRPQNSTRMSSAAGSPNREQDKVVSKTCPR